MAVSKALEINSTREGESMEAIGLFAWWDGFSFDDFLGAYPPMTQAKWARIESSVNLDAWGKGVTHHV